jgi:hypothetical protein
MVGNGSKASLLDVRRHPAVHGMGRFWPDPDPSNGDSDHTVAPDGICQKRPGALDAGPWRTDRGDTPPRRRAEPNTGVRRR